MIGRWTTGVPQWRPRVATGFGGDVHPPEWEGYLLVSNDLAEACLAAGLDKGRGERMDDA